MNHLRPLLVGMFLSMNPCLAFTVRGEKTGIVVIESDSDVLLGAIKRNIANENNHVVVRQGVVCVALRWGGRVENMFVATPTGVRPHDISSITFAFLLSPPTEKEREVIGEATFHLLAQKRDRTRCLVNVLPGKSVLTETLARQAVTQVETSCSDALGRLRAQGLSGESVAALETALGLGVVRTDAGGRGP